MFRIPAPAAGHPLVRTAPRVAPLAAAVGAALLHQGAFAADVVTRQVSFEHEGSEIVGTLYLPADAAAEAAVPAVVVTGSWTSVKEQMLLTAAGPEGSDALMAMDGYYSDPERGLIPEYDNRFNLASWEPWLTFDGVEIAERLTVPTLVVHSDAAAIPDGARAFVSRLTGPATQIWLEGVTQFDFYDDPKDVERAADAAAEHFEKTLPAS